ncbi:SEC-C domain-containing protein [Actinoplanes sp. NPDC049265]|uniref:SEC-C domain-containing protein n=1 Tax=Actinoplanes sp. NPDC049265 TaxID=3363902 RepID=UPI00371AEDC1
MDRGLDAYGGQDGSRVAAARALRARILFRVGRADDAMAELDGLRPLLTRYNDAPAYVSAALAVGGRNRVAEEWLTEATQSVLAERDGPEPASADDAGLLFFLLQQRHRVRHALGRSHDAHDNLADRLETRLANANARAAAELVDDLLFWPQGEFEQLLGQWPALSEAYGEDWDAHRARLERELNRLARAGRSDLSLLIGSVGGLTRFAGTDGDPADPQTRAGYAGQLRGQITWPPERNAACWCGSGSKYKKCCLPRGR